MKWRDVNLPRGYLNTIYILMFRKDQDVLVSKGSPSYGTVGHHKGVKEINTQDLNEEGGVLSNGRLLND